MLAGCFAGAVSVRASAILSMATLLSVCLDDDELTNIFCSLLDHYACIYVCRAYCVLQTKGREQITVLVCIEIMIAT